MCLISCVQAPWRGGVSPRRLSVNLKVSLPTGKSGWNSNTGKTKPEAHDIFINPAGLGNCGRFFVLEEYSFQSAMSADTKSLPALRHINLI
jgi:hypothetical protein